VYIESNRVDLLIITPYRTWSSILQRRQMCQSIRNVRCPSWTVSRDKPPLRGLVVTEYKDSASLHSRIFWISSLFCTLRILYHVPCQQVTLLVKPPPPGFDKPVFIAQCDAVKEHLLTRSTAVFPMTTTSRSSRCVARSKVGDRSE
jgi:hypothetical protein